MATSAHALLLSRPLPRSLLPHLVLPPLPSPPSLPSSAGPPSARLSNNVTISSSSYEPVVCLSNAVTISSSSCKPLICLAGDRTKLPFPSHPRRPAAAAGAGARQEQVFGRRHVPVGVGPTKAAQSHLAAHFSCPPSPSPPPAPTTTTTTTTPNSRATAAAGARAEAIATADAAEGGAAAPVASAEAAGELLRSEGVTKDGEQEEEEGEGKWVVKILYDGDCPLCMKEVNFLRQRNERFGTLKFVDISSDDYSPTANAGVSYEEAMGHIHGIKRDGTVVTGIQAFRVFYDALGLGWVYAATKLKPVEAVADAAYALWAKYRLPLTGRPSLDAVIEERRRAKEGLKGCSEEEECEAPW